ncbi:hypothetical protein N7471_007027 [Penicillium samsonianum]|uniref:uncharacterized protein n=1 Tax=Penicillium samsonianum TaxID=1882272 RepID=UPI0025482EBD|nr:uncharacterized protein N7471_007027 [Penicillium samsonianum]KAJ6131812.1 hypothetical protein N7471_007027 [Penicillium samsonianum]
MVPNKPPKKQPTGTPKRQYSEGLPLICGDTEECLAHLNELSRACHTVLHSKQNVIPGHINNEPSPPIEKPRDLLEMPLHTKVEWNSNADFDSSGDIYPERLSAGDPVIIWAFGLPFIPVYTGYYAMVGQNWSKHLWQLDHKVHNKKLSDRGFTFGQVIAPWISDTPRSDYAVHIDWDDLSTEPWAHRDIKKPSLVEHPSDMVLTVGNGRAMLTPLHNFVGFHPAIGPFKSRKATRPTGPDGIRAKAWQVRLKSRYTKSSDVHPERVSLVKSSHLASCDGPTPAYCETTESGDDESVADESDTGINSVNDPAPSNTPKARGKRKATTESAPVLSSSSNATVYIRGALGDYDSSALAVCDRIDRLLTNCLTFQSTRDVLNTEAARRVRRLIDEFPKAAAEYLTTYAEIRNSTSNCQEGAVRYMLNRALQNASLPDNDELLVDPAQSNRPIDHPSDEVVNSPDEDSIIHHGDSTRNNGDSAGENWHSASDNEDSTSDHEDLAVGDSQDSTP